MTRDLAAYLVDRLERSVSARSHHARAEVYPLLVAAGVDVERLAEDGRAHELETRRAALEAKLARRKLLRSRQAAGRLAPEHVAEVEARLARVATDIATMRATVRRLETRTMPPLPHSAPTAERVRNQGVAPVEETRDALGNPLSAPRYRWQWAVDRMQVPVTAEEYEAAWRLRHAWLTKDNTPGAVDPRGAGGNVPGPRLPIRDEQLTAAREWSAIWGQVPWELRAILLNFVLEEPPRGRSQCLDAIEFGQIYGHVKDRATARGVASGAVRTAIAALAGLYRGYDKARAAHRLRGPR